MRIELGVSNSAIGFLIFISFFGFTLSAMVSGFAADVVTDKPILAFGLVLLGGTVLLFPLVRSFSFLLFTYFIARLGVGGVDISASSQGTRLFQKNAAIKISLLHFTFAIGATIAPILGSRLLEIGFTWRRLLFLFSIPCAALFVLSIATTFTPQSRHPVKGIGRQFKSLIRSKDIWILGALLAIAIIGEANLVDWIKNYAIEIGGLDTIRSGNLIGIFYLFLMLSRVVSGFLAQRVGIGRFYLLYLVGALIMFGLAVTLPFSVILFAGVGWFVGPLFPLVTLMAARVFPNQKGSAMGLVFAIGGSIGTFNSFLLGVMHDLFGTRIGFSLMAVGLCAGIPLILYAQKRLKLDEG